MIGESRCHCRCAGLPPFGRARPVGRHRLDQWLTQTRVGQDKIMIDLEQDERLRQPRFTLARAGATSPNRRHSLAQAQIESFDDRRVDLPTAGGQDRIDLRLGADHHSVDHLDNAPPFWGPSSIRVISFKARKIKVVKSIKTVVWL